jgi:hypothetical protein
MSLRHLAWFRIDDGQWLGEWRGDLAPPPVHLLMQGGDARRIGMNAWLHEIQRLITPLGSPYACVEQVWDHVAWDECPDGGAVCVDVTKFGWPVGDQRFHVWDTVEAGIDYPDMREFIQVDRESHRIDANQSSSRSIRSSPEKAMLDITGTALAPFHRALTGTLSHEPGRWTIADAPAHIADGVRHALDAGGVDIDGALAPQKVLAP